VSKVVRVPKHHITEKYDGLEEWSHLCILMLMLGVHEFSASYFVSFISHKNAVIIYLVRIWVLLKSSLDMVVKRRMLPHQEVSQVKISTR